MKKERKKDHSSFSYCHPFGNSCRCKAFTKLYKSMIEKYESFEEIFTNTNISVFLFGTFLYY